MKHIPWSNINLRNVDNSTYTQVNNENRAPKAKQWKHIMYIDDTNEFTRMRLYLSPIENY